MIVWFAGAPEDSLWREAVQVQRVHQEFHPTGAPAEAPPGAHWRKTSPVRHLQETIQQHFQSQDTPSPALGPEAVRVRPVPGQIHPVRTPQTPQATPHQRKTLHVRRLPKEVHQRQWPQVTNEIITSS